MSDPTQFSECEQVRRSEADQPDSLSPSVRDEFDLIPWQSKAQRAIELPLNFPEAVSVPRYALGTRCRWIPMPETDWGTIIGQVYTPQESQGAEIPQWSWIYLLLLDSSSPSHQWLLADWVDEEDLELLPSSFSQADPQPQEEP